MNIKYIQTEYSVRDGGHYTPGVVHNGTLYVSGQLSINPVTGLRPEGGIKAEALQALKNLDLVLGSAGVSREQVLSCRIYIPDVAYWGEVNEVYSKFFDGHKPARIVIPTGPLYAGCLVEIEAIAAIGG